MTFSNKQQEHKKTPRNVCGKFDMLMVMLNANEFLRVNQIFTKTLNKVKKMILHEREYQENWI